MSRVNLIFYRVFVGILLQDLLKRFSLDEVGIAEMDGHSDLLHLVKLSWTYI